MQRMPALASIDALLALEVLLPVSMCIHNATVVEQPSCH